MKYSNLQILKELKHIKKCHKDTPQVRDCMDIAADCIYTDDNTGILNFLESNKYIIKQESQYNGRIVPFTTSYGNDFLKHNGYIKCFIEDYSWGINIIILLGITIITGVLIYLLTLTK